jgi:hypothetical protein
MNDGLRFLSKYEFFALVQQTPVQGGAVSYSIRLKTILLVLLFISLLVLLISRLRRKDIWSFRLTVLALLGIGVILLLTDVPYLDAALTHSLADALVIAAVLAFTVDIYLKDRVLREVSSDVSKYLVGYRLPEEVQNRIRSLLQTRWIERNCRIHLRLTEVPNTPGRVKVEITVSRDVENITTEEESFQDKFEYERHLPQRLLEMRCDSADTKAQYQLNPDGLVREKADEPGVMQALARVVRVPPVHESAGRYYQFRVRYEAEYPENYSDIVAFGRPTIGAIFEVECPAAFRVTVPPADISAPNRWEFRRLFLTGEHIRYRWERIPQPVAIAAPGANNEGE